jgi:4-amino-4-deoxy-L-arabinose transferase-like glycosyltransferase
LLVSALLLLARMAAARTLAFGDSEALYASYALFPQPAYLDHPGLISVVGRWLGRGDPPLPTTAHAFTSLVATLLPWVGALGARVLGCTWAQASRSVLALALVPELAVGLFAFCPDLLLALFWLGALAFAALALKRPPESIAAWVGTLGAGLCVGLATTAKITGALLGVALLAFSLTASQRRRWRSAAPYAAVAVFAVLVAPMVLWEASRGWPMLHHRLVTTQIEAGLSLRNLAALLGGQLVYVTPPFLFGVWLVLRALWRQRRTDPGAELLWLAAVVPGVPLMLLCLWSRQAEPHWLGPAMLSLAVALGQTPVISRRLGIASLATGAVVTAFAWLWVVTPLPIRILASHYRARFDIANDMYAWGPARGLLAQAIQETIAETGRAPVVVGPHWVVCAQARAALKREIAVGCNTPIRDDFDDWYPRARWLDAPSVLYVYDDRFPVKPEVELPGRTLVSTSHVRIRRGGMTVRTVRMARLDRTEGVARARSDGRR